MQLTLIMGCDGVTQTCVHRSPPVLSIIYNPLLTIMSSTFPLQGPFVFPPKPAFPFVLFLGGHPSKHKAQVHTQSPAQPPNMAIIRGGCVQSSRPIRISPFITDEDNLRCQPRTPTNPLAEAINIMSDVRPSKLLMSTRSPHLSA